MSFSQTLTVPPQGRTSNALCYTYQSTVTDVPSPPLPVENYTMEDLKDRLIYADRVLRNSQRRLSPIGTRALQIYKDACARLLNLEQENGDLEMARDVWRATLRAYDQTFYFTPCLRVVRSSDAQVLQDRLIDLQKTTFYTRYANIFAELCIQMKTVTGPMHKPYWTEIYGKLLSEKDTYRRLLSGGRAHYDCPTYLAISHACDQIGFSHSTIFQTICQYAKLNDPIDMNIFSLIKTGKFDDLKKHLHSDSRIIPLLVYSNDWKLIKLLKRVIEFLTDLWFVRGKIDLDKYQMWTYTKALRSLYTQLHEEDAVAQKSQLADAIARKIRKRLRDAEDDEKALESLSKTIGPLRQSGIKRAKGAALLLSSWQLRAEREQAKGMTADWNKIMNLVRHAKEASIVSLSSYRQIRLSLDGYT
ncbi:hypothetical protein PAAG_02356 [Paracoccidioides lutzii Pb01]|uniref:Uncharacterized protein n=1 Tax=Paracoccidioides lutzii (strain ATCC MYA-826 / Pb01) TaxID=502779 RepID=C1GUN3_PARBA|nr:hypothetical protein PAAG_02356 [Paracoccidioides lutzii Pb01]EEH40301.2 hypothetical protein PAAG_02356 [Paracoccidioides lutzii Pb01]